MPTSLPLPIRHLAALVAIAVWSPASAALCNPFEPKSLPAWEVALAEDYPAFAHMSAEAVQGVDAATTLLLDVREADEYAVSHLAGAVQIDPDASADALRHLIRPRMQGPQPITRVVFYCSVGYRSSRLAERARKALADGPMPTLVNLRGGIFAWANRGLPVVDARGPTRAVHPFDDCRAPLLSPSARQ